MPYRCHFETIKAAEQNGVAFNYMALYGCVIDENALFVVINILCIFLFFSPWEEE